jgi:hypothetical protein
MFKEILSISGRPGLFKLISQSKNMVIVESLLEGKRFPSYPHEKISALKDIAMFSQSGEKTLGELFKKTFELENGQKIALSPKSSPEELRQYFVKILPDFDQEKIYPNDIKRFIQWYNILLDSKITDFDPEEQTKDEGKKVEQSVKKAETKQQKVANTTQKTSARSVAAKQRPMIASKKGS